MRLRRGLAGWWAGSLMALVLMLHVGLLLPAASSSASSAPSSPGRPDPLRLKNDALSESAPRARARGKLTADAAERPQHWVRSEDPAHPNMRTSVDLEDAHAVNVMPENSFWKDHDSDVRTSPLGLPHAARARAREM
jgi:hypothetical protein